VALILVVEDEPPVRDTIVDILHHLNHDVRIAATASGAVEMARDERPDVVLLDILLPDARGTVVLDWLRTVRPDVPVVMVSANDSEALARQTLQRGAFDYITKPFDMDRLIAVVEAALAGSVERC
jgi:DNA-binding response OmpR family regulator